MSVNDETKKDNDEDKPKLELPYLFEKEIYNKQNKKIIILNKYIPTERVIPVANKFHSRHDQNENISYGKNIVKHMTVIENLYKRPAEKYLHTKLESQEYGWVDEKFLNRNNSKYLRNKYDSVSINRIVAPKIRGNLTIYGEKLLCEKVTERQKFYGEQFYLR